MTRNCTQVLPTVYTSNKTRITLKPKTQTHLEMVEQIKSHLNPNCAKLLKQIQGLAPIFFAKCLLTALNLGSGVQTKQYLDIDHVILAQSQRFCSKYLMHLTCFSLWDLFFCYILILKRCLKLLVDQFF